MKHALRKLSLLALMAYAVPLAALAPADIARLEQEVRAAIADRDYLLAQDLLARLEGAGARATAQPLRTQLAQALEKKAIGQMELERLYNRLAEREIKPLRRLRQELEGQVKRLKEENQRIVAEHDKLQKQLNANNQYLNEITRDIDEMQAERDSAIKARDQVQKQLQDITKERDELLDEYANRIEQLDKAKKQIADLQRDLKRAREETGVQQRKASSLQVQIKELEDELQEINKRSATWVNELTQNKNEVARLQDVVNRLNKQTEVVRSRLREALNDARSQASDTLKYTTLNAAIGGIVDNL
ncbi:MAG: hypothetical protein ACOYT8_01095 [Candidatus Dependentiae bacterium]